MICREEIRSVRSTRHTSSASRAAVFLVAMWLALLPLAAVGAPSHYSNIKYKNDCAYRGYHHYTSGFLEAITFNWPDAFGFENCIQVRVTASVNGYTLTDYDESYARVAVSANIYSFDWSDHDANYASGWWIGFHMY